MGCLCICVGCEKRQYGMSSPIDRSGYAHTKRDFGMYPTDRAYDVVSRNGHEQNATPECGVYDAPVPGPGEMYYTLTEGDNLIAVSKKFNVECAWLIKRNDIQSESQLKPGYQLIVPRIDSKNESH